AGLNVKHIQRLASEQDLLACATFICCISQYPANYLIPLDEMAKDVRTYAWLWGCLPQGTRCEHHDPFVQTQQLSLLAALVLNEGIVAARVLEGSYTYETFCEFLHVDLIHI
ncbi:hypothetical protein PAXINDRAFT_79036, partial [Paxillus involutus ATCC 200175]